MPSIQTIVAVLLGAFSLGVSATSFPEQQERRNTKNGLLADSIQLTEQHVGDFSAIAFGNRASAGAETTATKPPQQRCRVFPGDSRWPPEKEWTLLNSSLDGALLQPQPAYAVCYPDHPAYDAARCLFLLHDARSTHFWLDDPLTELAQWTQGSTCLATDQTMVQGRNCTRGGFPEYVVNATVAKHVQIAVNFARNKGLRLVIKNTGHDFGGRSVGAGSLSVWVHHMKEMQYIPAYTIGSGNGSYTGMAARLGTGVEATVGGVGGWVGGGGHSVVSSTLGLGADQVLALRVVTADGRYVTADPFTNPDLFFALRGGGGGPSEPTTDAIVVRDADAFWAGVGLYYRFCGNVIEASEGGQGFSYIYPQAGGGLRLTTTSSFLNRSRDEVSRIMQPLYTSLRRARVLATADADPTTGNPSVYGASRRSGNGYQPVNTRYRSRLLPRANWADDARWNATMAAIRTATEAGYDEGFYFHGTLTSPTREVAGWPGEGNAVNPAWRENLMHAMLMDVQPDNYTSQQARDRDARMQRYTGLLRDVSPGAGAYINEADPGEPNWQQAFFGSDNYARLLQVKRTWDPWSLFWAPTTVGSEGWRVEAVDGYPNSQNGRLCRSD
ncbi:FAD-binding domain-containing protein [Apiospora kogelbergensis]|uniref:FAD-binding domain-containing protein n=1 Tax=Apiospora kogelbergensis TaxID=1337665 RepID=A0AAW0QFV9_9PEZI